MSGVEREQTRVKATGEVFTPTELVQEVLDQYNFDDAEQPFMDPSCGDGQFLGEVLIRKLESGMDFETALAGIQGMDIMQDNVDLCRERLLCGHHHLRHIVERNIVCTNGLEYNWNFEQAALFDGLYG